MSRDLERIDEAVFTVEEEEVVELEAADRDLRKKPKAAIVGFGGGDTSSLTDEVGAGSFDVLASGTFEVGTDSIMITSSESESSCFVATTFPFFLVISRAFPSFLNAPKSIPSLFARSRAKAASASAKLRLVLPATIGFGGEKKELSEACWSSLTLFGVVPAVEAVRFAIWMVTT